jgi:DnaJ family protein C protein 7
MNKKLDRNYYDILEIDRTADDGAIKKAYKKAALVHHPDKGGSDDMF